MTRRAFPVLAAALVLSGCQQEAAAPTRAQRTAALEQQKARIDALSKGQRNAVFLRAIRDGGQDCQQVLGSAYGGAQSGRPSWVARCGDGRDWIIILEADGRALVARREETPAQR